MHRSSAAAANRVARFHIGIPFLTSLSASPGILRASAHKEPIVGRPRCGSVYIHCRCPWALAASTSTEAPERSDRGARKGDAEGAIDDGNTLIDSSARQLAFLAGLESHIVEQRRLAESVFGDLIGVVNTLPLPGKVQQRVSHRFAELRRPDDEGFRNRGMVDPLDLTAGGLFDDPIRAADMVVRWLGNYAEGHHRASSNRDWN